MFSADRIVEIGDNGAWIGLWISSIVETTELLWIRTTWIWIFTKPGSEGKWILDWVGRETTIGRGIQKDQGIIWEDGQTRRDQITERIVDYQIQSTEGKTSGMHSSIKRGVRCTLIAAERKNG